MNPYSTVEEFEKSVAEYAGSKYAVATDNCTNALFLCCKYLGVDKVSIPKFTYISVPCAIIHAGGKITFEDVDWEDHYQLSPYPIYDAACCFRKNMYIQNSLFCISFSASKTINIGKGGMILTNNEDFVSWAKQARYSGRHEVPLSEEKDISVLGWNMYMTPEQAARGLNLMLHVGEGNITRKKGKYTDLSRFSVFGG